MDRKTLEYMQERVNKANSLIRRIDQFNKSLEKIQIAEKVAFSTKQHGNFVELEGYELLKVIRKKSIEAINQEIERLEKELAEL